VGELSGSKMPWHGWVVTGVLVLFGLASAFDYLMSITQGREFYEASGMSEDQIEYFLSVPVWVVVAWTASVWFGLIAALSAMLRLSLSPALFVATAVGNVAYGIYVYWLSDGVEAMGVIWFMPLVITLINCAMVIYSRKLANSRFGS